jgi:hypothetical protein
MAYGSGLLTDVHVAGIRADVRGHLGQGDRLRQRGPGNRGRPRGPTRGHRREDAKRRDDRDGRPPSSSFSSASQRHSGPNVQHGTWWTIEVSCENDRSPLCAVSAVEGIDQFVEVGHAVDAVDIVERPLVEHFTRGTNDGGQARAAKRGADRHPAHPEFLELAEGKPVRAEAGDVVERFGDAAAGQAECRCVGKAGRVKHIGAGCVERP